MFEIEWIKKFFADFLHPNKSVFLHDSHYRESHFQLWDYRSGDGAMGVVGQGLKLRIGVGTRKEDPLTRPDPTPIC